MSCHTLNGQSLSVYQFANLPVMVGLRHYRPNGITGQPAQPGSIRLYKI